MKNTYSFLGQWKYAIFLMLLVGACVAEPYYDGGPGPVYDYGYGGPAAYPWYTGADVDIVAGYGHGWYGRGGGWSGGGYRGGGGRGGGSRGGGHGDGGRH